MPHSTQKRANVAGPQDGVELKSGFSQTVASNGEVKAGLNVSRDGLPTGEGTAGKDDVADPHTTTEEDYDQIPRPGGVRRPRAPDIGPNSYVHDGAPPARPRNRESGPK